MDAAGARHAARFSLAGQVALVVGGGSGIGLAIALGLRDAGATVCIAGRNRDKLDAAARSLSLPERAAHACPADVLIEAQREALVRGVVQQHGQLDLLVNSQGAIVIQPAQEFSEAQYDTVMDTNAKSVYFMCQAAGRHMLARGSGSIINIASLSSFRGWPNSSVYGLSKHGVLSITETLASEWGTRGVRVNAIAPGFFMTELNRDRMKPERKARALDRTPMGRFGEVEELIGAAVYLASPAARFVTGSTLRVDGGYLAAGI
jgi:NAD(P)-dependent dehydrogenase (short-subunit alcohol dehydrogenase family)